MAKVLCLAPGGHLVRVMKNIVFSTTRQWNPGDEFILMGVRNILAALDLAHNPVIFNRNPDIRSQFPQLFKQSRVPFDFNLNDDTRLLEGNLKFGFFDNSLKPDTDCSCIDWVILAGTPEWCNGRMADLYASILKYNLPVMILGVGGDFDLYDESFREVIDKAKARVVRDASTHDALHAQGYNAQFLPCPALLSALPSQTRRVESVRKVGLIYQATRDETVIWNGFSEKAYAYMRDLYRNLIQRYGTTYEFEFICHYVDELPLAARAYPGHEIFYSFDSRDYFDIYSRFDFVIGPRVHGIGISASLGIPGIALTHDTRGSTCAGFLAPQIGIGDEMAGALESIHQALQQASVQSSALASHKEATLASYKEIVARALENPQVAYQQSPPKRNAATFDLSELRPLAKIFRRFEAEKNGL